MGENYEITDLLERALDKGAIIQTDAIIDLVGIPLIGLNLRLAIASVSTMLKWGFWRDWDKAQRAAEKEKRKQSTR